MLSGKQPEIKTEYGEYPPGCSKDRNRILFNHGSGKGKFQYRPLCLLEKGAAEVHVDN